MGGRPYSARPVPSSVDRIGEENAEVGVNLLLVVLLNRAVDVRLDRLVAVLLHVGYAVAVVPLEGVARRPGIDPRRVPREGFCGADAASRPHRDPRRRGDHRRAGDDLGGGEAVGGVDQRTRLGVRNVFAIQAHSDQRRLLSAQRKWLDRLSVTASDPKQTLPMCYRTSAFRDPADGSRVPRTESFVTFCTPEEVYFGSYVGGLLPRTILWARGNTQLQGLNTKPGLIATSAGMGCRSENRSG